MGLFIWNDRRWQFLENEDSEYDRTNYFVIRKLFVRWLKSSDTKGINAKIRKAFEKFGTIESVDDVTSSTAKAKPDVHEAYVTFQRSEDAYKAFIENRNDTKSSDEVITVLPIDTWKMQTPVPSKDDEVSELSKRITKVDEESTPQYIYRMCITPGMLLRVFRSFLHVSTDFLEGLDLYYELEEEYGPSSDEESEQSTETEVAFDAETEHEVGSNDEVEEEEEEDDEEEEPETECLNHHEYEKRIAEVVVKNLGPKFETLTIRKDEIVADMLQWFEPVLAKIKTLTIHTDTDCSILYALASYCPNVTSMNLNGETWTGDFEDATVVAWPSLQELHLDVCDSTDENNRKFRKFIQLNPQLTSMQIDSMMDVDTLVAIGQTLAELDNLAIKRANFEGLNQVLDSLVSLTELSGLKITALKVEKDHLNGLVKCAKRLSRLPNLELITIFINCQSAENEDFRYLGEYSITHHNNCKCHGPNRVLSMRDRDISVPEESSILVLIVNTKSPSLSTDKTMEAEILSTFKKAAKFFPNIIEHIEVPEKDHYVYIQISSNR